MKKVICFLLVAVFLLFRTEANASEQREKSTLYMNSGETVTGATRSYNYDYYKIELYPTRLGYLEGDIGMYNKLYIRIEKKGLISYSSKGSTTITGMNTLGKKYQASFGKLGSGKYRYIFNTGSSTNPYGLIEANPVYMYSYD